MRASQPPASSAPHLRTKCEILSALLQTSMREREGRSDCGPKSPAGQTYPRVVGAALTKLIEAVARDVQATDKVRTERVPKACGLGRSNEQSASLPPVSPPQALVWTLLWPSRVLAGVLADVLAC